MRKKRYPSVAPEPRTSAKSLWAEAAEIGVSSDEIDAPAVLQAEGYLPKGGTPSAGKYNVSLGSPPQAEVQDEVPFTGGSGEGWSENSPYALSVDSATARSGVCSRVIKGWSFDSPVGLSNSPMIAIRTSPDDALGEAAEISLDVHNETAVLQMEGGLPAGSAPYRNALGVGAESKLVACSSEGWSENSPSEAGNNELHVEWEVPQRSWKVPPHVVQFKHRVSTIK
ncbi:hypothetical protein B0H11DRAFT_1935265 [Mycena galericulata]|nr:hypothetical protein B0H11DRAFT_1935265 [Mycena galericulata]